MGGLTILSSILVFLVVILSLVGILIFTKSKLAPAGKIKIKINGEKEIEVDGGGTLLTTLSDVGGFLPQPVGVVVHVFNVLVKSIVEEGVFYQLKSLTFLEKK